MLKTIRILFIFISLAYGQNAEELKRFMQTYDKLKVDQEANEVVKKGIESEKDPEERPVRLLIDPADMTKYYLEKMNVIRKDLDQLNRLLIMSDSVPPISHFGYDYFSLRDSIQFIDNANVASNYILSYGDEVIISIWGQAEQHERKILDRDGTIFIENVGLLYLGGKTQSQAKSYVFNRFGKVYSTLNSNPKLTFLEFSIGKIKNINVSVSGHVQFPGNYVVNPSISIPNLLILSGGINSSGTLRSIFLQRDGVFIDTLDLYPLITGIGIAEYIPIFEGDIIVVPPRGETVAVTGDVLTPAFFEVESQETINTLLQYSGIKNSNNYVLVSRLQKDNLLISRSNFNKTTLVNGDSLIVPNYYRSKKQITISIPDRPIVKIPWIQNLSFSKILSIVNVNSRNVQSVELIRRNKQNNQKEVFPFNSVSTKNFELLPFDHLSIHLVDLFSPTKTVFVKGEINSPGTYPLIKSQETLISVIDRAGGLQNSTNINNVVVKRDTLIFGSNTGKLFLTPGDTVIARPLLGTVLVEGEVHNPGNFEWEEDKSAKDYLSFAGGLTTYGDKKHIIYITSFGKAIRINSRSGISVLPGSTIRVSEKPYAERNNSPDRFQQISTLVTSLVSIAILSNTINK